MAKGNMGCMSKWESRKENGVETYCPSQPPFPTKSAARQATPVGVSCCCRNHCWLVSMLWHRWLSMFISIFCVMSFGDCTKLKTPSNYHHSAGYTITNYWTLHSKQDLKQVWSVIITIYWLLIRTLSLVKRNLERSLTSFNFVFIFTVKLIPSLAYLNDSFFFQIKSVSNNNEHYNLSELKVKYYFIKWPCLRT